MTRKIWILGFACVVLLLMAGSTPAGNHSETAVASLNENDPAAIAQAGITTRLGYKVGLLLDGLWYPSGIAVSKNGDSIYFGQGFNEYVYWHHAQKITPIETPTNGLICFHVQGSLFIGDVDGNIYRIDGRNGVTWLGQDYYMDDVGDLDVDPQTGTIYFITNYFEDSFQWAGLYKLRQNSSTAVLLTSWTGAPSWGMALKGDYIYISDRNYGSIRRYHTLHGTWELVVDGALNTPTDLCFDKQGNIFVTETYVGSVARVKAGSGEIVRIASGLQTPYYLAIDGSDILYVTDVEGGRIWKIRK